MNYDNYAFDLNVSLVCRQRQKQTRDRDLSCKLAKSSKIIYDQNGKLLSYGIIPYDIIEVLELMIYEN